MVQIGDFGSIPKLNCRTQKQDSVFVLKPGILAQLKNVVRVTAVHITSASAVEYCIGAFN